MGRKFAGDNDIRNWDRCNGGSRVPAVSAEWKPALDDKPMLEYDSLGVEPGPEDEEPPFNRLWDVGPLDSWAGWTSWDQLILTSNLILKKKKNTLAHLNRKVFVVIFFNFKNVIYLWKYFYRYNLISLITSLLVNRLKSLLEQDQNKILKIFHWKKWDKK